MTTRFALPRLGAVAAVAAVLAAPAGGQEPLLWGSLKPGPFAVGYRVQVQLDHSREYDPGYTADPAKPPPHSPRPILICAWYPARKTIARPMAYREYLDLPPGDAATAPFVNRLGPHVRRVVCEEVTGKLPTRQTPVEAAALDRFLATPTLSVKDAPPVAGRFPVVLYHPGLGGSYEDNAVLFELLASHGYVVLSSAYPSNEAATMNCGGDLHTSFRDMEFLARHARGLGFADADRLAAMGHSYGAIAAVTWAALPHNPLRAFVTLDSGLEYGAVEDTGCEPFLYHMRTNKGTIRAAALRCGSQEREASAEHLRSHLKHAPDYVASVAGLTHNDYLTQGAIRPSLLPEKWPDPAGTRRRGYDLLCQHVRTFLDATLKEQPEAREALQRSVRGEGLDAGFRLEYRPPAPVRPTSRQFAQSIRRHGAEKAAALLRQTFPDDAYGRAVGAAMDLMADGDVATALPHLTLSVARYPTDARLHALLAQALAVTGDRAGARAAIHKAAELLPAADTLGGTRGYWKWAIDRDLKELGQPE